MDKSPLEILEMIIDEMAIYNDYTSRLDLCSLRMTSKRLAETAAPALFRNVPLWIGMSSLEKLSKIAEHKQLYRLLAIKSHIHYS